MTARDPLPPSEPGGMNPAATTPPAERATTRPDPDSGGEPARGAQAARHVAAARASAKGPYADRLDADRLKAIGLMVIAVTLFSALDASAKYLVTREHVPLVQVLWCRFAVQFTGLLLIVPALGVMSAKALFTTSRLGLQSLRSFLMVSVTGLNFLALEYLRLDQTITITFLAPLMVALFAGPLLGEWVGWRRLMAILVGFLGIVVAVRPGFANVPPAVLYSLGAMLTYASFMLLTRYMAGADPPLVTLFWSMIAGTILGAPIALLHWQTPPDFLSWGLLCSLGILGGTGHWLFIHAYRLAPASVVTPFLYAQLLSMIAFGYAVFGDLPDAWTLAGAAIVVASGIYLFHREHAVARERKAASSP